MKRKLIASLIVLVMLLSLLSACGSSDTAAETTEAEEATTVTEEAETTETEAAETAEAEQAEETAEPEDETQEAESEETEAEADSLEYAEPLTYPLSEENITFTFMHVEPQLGPLSGQMNMADYGAYETIALGSEYMGVTPEWITLSQENGDTQFNLVIVSGDYPDVIGSVDKYYSGGMQKAYTDEVIMALDDYIMEYMPDYWNLIISSDDLLRGATNDDGEFLACYSVYDKIIVNEGYFIRKDWCDELGLSLPTSIAELNEFVYAAKTAYDLDSVLMMDYQLATMIDAWGLNETVASGSGFAYHRVGDEIIADVSSDEYREYIEQLHQWYIDGIVSQNFIELETANMSGDTEAELAANRAGVVKSMVTSMDSLVNDDPDFELAAIVVTDDGGNIHTGGGSIFADSCSISTTCDESLYPYIMGWLNYWYTDEGAMLGSYGIEGVDYEYDENGEIYYTDAIMNNEYGYSPALFTRSRCFAGAAFGLIYQDRTAPFYDDAQQEAVDTWSSRLDDEQAIPASLSLNTEEAETVALYATDLATYIAEEIPKFVTGSKDLSEWDTFIANCEDMHLADLTAAYQSCYDRYISK